MRTAPAAAPRPTPTMASTLRALLTDPRDRLFVFVYEEALAPPDGGGDAADTAETIRLLGRLSEVGGNAVVVLSDRSLDAVDRSLAPLRLPGCGQSGLEIRGPGGDVVRSRVVADLDPVRRRMQARCDAGLDIVDEGLAIGLHHGGDPELEIRARELARSAVALAPAFYRVRFDRDVTRVTFAGASKGRALAQIMCCDRFIERIPLVFCGRSIDDVGAAARSFGGNVISVGECAGDDGDVSLPGINDVRWLIRDFLADLSARSG